MEGVANLYCLANTADLQSQYPHLTQFPNQAYLQPPLNCPLVQYCTAYAQLCFTPFTVMMSMYIAVLQVTQLSREHMQPSFCAEKICATNLAEKICCISSAAVSLHHIISSYQAYTYIITPFIERCANNNMRTVKTFTSLTNVNTGIYNAG